jgi:(2Fe-2S) ferredoxin
LVDCAAKVLARTDPAGDVDIVRFTCFDHCDDGPNLFVEKVDGKPKEPDGDLFRSQRGFYDHMDEGKLERVLSEHCASGRPVDDLVGDY